MKAGNPSAVVPKQSAGVSQIALEPADQIAGDSNHSLVSFFSSHGLPNHVRR